MPAPGPHRNPRTGGIPDGLLTGAIAFLLALTFLVWATTGLAGLAAHGSWPQAVDLDRTPMALRHLMTQPRDLAAAWPQTPPEQLSGYGLFWGFLIGEVLALIVLWIFVLSTWTRWRVVRARRRETERADREGASVTEVAAEAVEPTPRRTEAVPVPGTVLGTVPG
ncbi:type VI secretion protein, partial [Streptomyces sp. UNOC14_S4]|nr:type VI secretion protein [Streptomyces sp. UNOC14_S4]